MKSGFVVLMIIALLVGFGIFMVKDSGANGNVIEGNSGSGEIQEVVLGFKNYNYYPNTVTVKVNQPVRIYLDKSVYGCFRSFTIRDFGISKYLQSEKDYVEFTPTKPGKYQFSCSMGMGTGTLIVE